MRELIEHLSSGHELNPEQIERAIAFLTDPDADEASKADFLRSLREKGETADEIAGFVRALLDRAVPTGLDLRTLGKPAIDVCGTGGDRMELFNVSTAAMFIVAAAGAAVVKHGNRAVTSKCGGADVLEALGVRIDLPPDRFGPCIQETGCGFMFAPAWHPAFKAIVPVRIKLAAEGVPTIFNLLGPLLNPARPPFQLVGVFSADILPKYADTLKLLGRERAWAVHGRAPGGRGIDEVSTMGPTTVCAVEAGQIRRFEIDPDAYDLPPASPADLQGGSREDNAAIVAGILSGDLGGPKRDLVLVNAAAALAVCGVAANLGDSLELARRQIQSGAAADQLEKLRQFTNR